MCDRAHVSASQEIVRQFRSLFAGRRDAYGLRDGRVVRALVTDRRYALHLAAVTPIGIFPLRADGTVYFCAIDLDRKDPDLAWRLAELLPGAAWVERTRSEHYHVWSFFESPCRAYVARGVMLGVIEALGERDIEVFPKTDLLRPGFIGNYINLPYPGWSMVNKERRQVILNSFNLPIPLHEFVYEANETRANSYEWHTRAKALGVKPPEERESTTEFGEQENLHACAEYIIEGARYGIRPLQEGHRSKVLFALAKMLLNWRGLPSIDYAERQLMRVNGTGDRPLPAREVKRILRSALDGRYTSTSCDDPVVRPYVRPDCLFRGEPA